MLVAVRPAPGGAKTKQGLQQDPQIEPGKMDDGALLHIGQSAKMHPPHAAPVKTVGKAALHPLAPRPQKRPLCPGSLIRLVQASGKSFSTFRL